MDSKTTEAVHNDINHIRLLLKQAIVGQPALVEAIIIGKLISGHVLLESEPGLGKTTAAKAAAQVFGGSFARVQCAPDLMPSDFTGSLALNLETNMLEAQFGPLFNDVVLLDELNRCGGRALSGVLEAMGEGHISIGGFNYPLPSQFIVLATQNPREHAGTYDLPDAVADRFALSAFIGHPSREDEIKVIMGDFTHFTSLEPAFKDDPDRWCELRALVDEVSFGVSYELAGRIADFVSATRTSLLFRQGAGVRAGIVLRKAAAVNALGENRNAVVFEDVKAVAPYVLRHRVITQNIGQSVDEAIAEFIAQH